MCESVLETAWVCLVFPACLGTAAAEAGRLEGRGGQESQERGLGNAEGSSGCELETQSGHLPYTCTLQLIPENGARTKELWKSGEPQGEKQEEGRGWGSQVEP